jgi:hypothetical protein
MKSQSSVGRILSAFLLATGALGAGCGIAPEEENLAQVGATESLGEATQALWQGDPRWDGGREVRTGVGSNLCLSVDGTVGAGKNVVSRTCDGTKSQKWTLTAEGYLRSGLNPSYCLDVTGGGTANGTNVQLYPCNGTNSQRWSHTARGEFRSALGPNLCLDVTGASTASGANVQLYTCNGTVAQQWFDVPRLPVSSMQDPSITIDNVKLNGLGNSLVRVKPNQLIPMEISYSIYQASWCESCIDQIAIGFPSSFQGCIYDGIPYTSGTSGNSTGYLVAPSTPGVHYLRFKPTMEYGCNAAVWSSTSEANNIAVITVTDSYNQ